MNCALKTGKEYSHSGLINLRAGLNCHLHAPPYKKSYDLMKDRVFTQANLVLTGRLRHNKDKGLDTASPRTSIEKEDVQGLFTEYFPKCFRDQVDTEILLHKFFWDIMHYTGNRGKEGLRKVSKRSFVIKKVTFWRWIHWNNIQWKDEEKPRRFTSYNHKCITQWSPCDHWN